MTDWFARPVLHVTDIEASLLFYVNRLGFTSPWRYDEDGRAHVAQVDRQGCALILADTWPEKVGKGLMFISLNVERSPRWTRCARNSRPRAFRLRRVRGATGSWWSMIPTEISSSSTIRARLHPTKSLEVKRNRPDAPQGRQQRRRVTL
jgi:hypothetical protein